jgi:predicted RND superfamily exporter protein
MKAAHSILATVGLLVIVGVFVAALADAWVTLLIAIGIAAVAGMITRLVMPRDQRERLFGRLGR